MLSHCHSDLCGNHFTSAQDSRKILLSKTKIFLRRGAEWWWWWNVLGKYLSNVQSSRKLGMFWNNFDRFRFPKWTANPLLHSYLHTFIQRQRERQRHRHSLIAANPSHYLHFFIHSCIPSSFHPTRRRPFWGKTFISGICKNPTRSSPLLPYIFTPVILFMSKPTKIDPVRVPKL